MKWIRTEDKKPEFGKPVLVKCKIYGRFIATYEQLENSKYGNWRYQNELGILPPTHWMELPE